MPDGYILVAEIDRGGFGRVERVTRTSDGVSLARKVFSPHPGLAGVDLGKLRKRFIREVKIQTALKAEFFLPVLDFDLSAPEPWYVMPAADKSYAAQIAEDRQAGAINPNPLADILNGLEQLHKLGYVHRDLKPGNVLKHDDRWKLSDFGLVLPPSGSTTKLTSTASGWGTMAYCAPEQMKEFSSVGPTADIYAFGCILHDLYDGNPRVPYAKQTCPGPIGYIIEKCTEPDPSRRFRSVSGLRAALLTELGNPAAVPMTPEASQWVSELSQATLWAPSQLEGMVRFLEHAGVEQVHAIMSALDEERIAVLHKLDQGLWETLGRRYADWVAGTSFAFAFCDVLIGRLRAFFDLGDITVKSEVAMAAVELAISHNRWYVMGRVIDMCGPSLDDDCARRIGIEIQAADASTKFQACCERIHRSVDDYHPRIAQVLQG